MGFRAAALAQPTAPVADDRHLELACYYTEFPMPVVDARLRESAALILDKRRPWHWLRRPTLRVYHITEWGAAVQLLVYMEKLTAEGISVGFDYETENWEPARKLPGMRGGKKKVTRGLSPLSPAWQSKPVSVQFSWGTAAYVVDGALLPVFAEWLKERAILDTANAFFEIHTSRNVGIHVPRFHRDLLHQDFLLEETLRQYEHNLKAIERAYMGLQPLEYGDAIEPHGDYKKALVRARDIALAYGGFDSFGTVLGCDILEDHLARRPAREGYNSAELYMHWERAVEHSFILMEQAGTPFNLPAAVAHDARLTEAIRQVDIKAYKTIGRIINLSGSKDLINYLFVVRGHQVIKTGAAKMCFLCKKQTAPKYDYACKVHGHGAIINTPAKDDDVLEALVHNGEPLAQILQQRRTYDKERSTYVDGFYKFAHGGEPLLHPSLRANYVVSGRLSGGIYLTAPKHTRDMIGFFDPATTPPEVMAKVNELAPGYVAKYVAQFTEPMVIVGGDFGQLELRVITHLSQDPAMLRAFLEGRDMHAWTAALIVAFYRGGEAALSDMEAVTKVYLEIKAAEAKEKAKEKLTAAEADLLEQRQRAKRLNFGLIYGMGPDKLAQQLGCSTEEAQMLFDVLWRAYVSTKKFYDMLRAQVRRDGYLKTLNGRNRRIPEYAMASQQKQAAADRLVSNQPPQAGGRDITVAVQIQLAIDQEAGGLYGTVGRGTFGHWVDNVYHLDPKMLPKGWFKDGKANLPKALQENLGQFGRWGFRTFLQVHDELLLWGPARFADAARERLSAIMADPFGDDLSFRCPLIAGVRSAATWKEAK